MAAPSEGQFEFAAPQDGEYWFAVRTIDRLGNATPEGTPEPEARLVIDSTPPQLRLKASLAADGRLIASWQAHDPRLLEGSLQLEYRAIGDTEWLPYPLEPLDAGPGNSTSGGRINWLPPVDGEWELRAIASDTAGNQATIVAATNDSPTNATNAVNPQDNQQLHSALTQEPTAPLPLAIPRDTDLRQQPLPPLLPNSNQSAGNGSNIERNDAFNQDWTAANQRTPVRPQPPFQQQPTIPAQPTNQFTDQGNPFGANPVPYRPIGLTTDASGESIADRGVQNLDIEPRELIPGSASATNFTGIPADEPVLYVNSLRFFLEFDPRPSSVALDANDAVREVQAWGTVNGGQTWSRFAIGRSSEAQLGLEVSAPGRYGFRLIEIDSSALQLPPRSGDRPEVWVVVDLSPPVCQLINATQGDDVHINELTITWSASDEQLAGSAITLQYATTPSGPWETIVQGVENTGSYLWRMGSNVPPRFHLRLLAQDMAGNYGEYISRVPVEPIRRDFGRITGVRPADSAPMQRPNPSEGFHSAQRGQ